MVKQLRLDLGRPAPRGREHFIASPTNADAVRAIDAWPAWRGRRLALVGPPGTGKSHLALDWALETGAVIVGETAPDLASLRGHPVLVDDADQRGDDELLFHLIDMAEQEGGGLLLTGRTPPSQWPCALPDLRSRLNALPVAELGEPDDAVLEGVLRKFFAQAHLRPNEDIYPYLLRRMERSAPAAREIVRRLDEAAEAQGRGVSRALAREVIEGAEEAGDLFER